MSVFSLKRVFIILACLAVPILYLYFLFFTLTANQKFYRYLLQHINIPGVLSKTVNETIEYESQQQINTQSEISKLLVLAESSAAIRSELEKQHNAVIQEEKKSIKSRRELRKIEKKLNEEDKTLQDISNRLMSDVVASVRIREQNEKNLRAILAKDIAVISPEFDMAWNELIVSNEIMPQIENYLQYITAYSSTNMIFSPKGVPIVKLPSWEVSFMVNSGVYGGAHTRGRIVHFFSGLVPVIVHEKGNLIQEPRVLDALARILDNPILERKVSKELALAEIQFRGGTVSSEGIVFSGQDALRADKWISSYARMYFFRYFAVIATLVLLACIGLKKSGFILIMQSIIFSAAALFLYFYTFISLKNQSVDESEIFTFFYINNCYGHFLFQILKIFLLIFVLTFLSGVVLRIVSRLMKGRK